MHLLHKSFLSIYFCNQLKLVPLVCRWIDQMMQSMDKLMKLFSGISYYSTPFRSVLTLSICTTIVQLSQYTVYVRTNRCY